LLYACKLSLSDTVVVVVDPSVVVTCLYQGDTQLENLEKSGNSKVVREKWKKSGEVKSGVFFQALNTPELVFRPELCPGPNWGANYAPLPQTP